jgi:hypothetical protein
VLNTVDPFNQVAVPVPVEDEPVSVILAFEQVSTPFAVAEILTEGAWLF